MVLNVLHGKSVIRLFSLLQDKRCLSLNRLGGPFGTWAHPGPMHTAYVLRAQSPTLRCQHLMLFVEVQVLEVSPSQYLTRQHTCQCRMLGKAQTWTQSQLPWGRCEQQQHFQPAVWINSLRQDRGFLVLCQWQGADLAKEGLKLKHSQSKASSLQRHPK